MTTTFIAGTDAQIAETYEVMAQLRPHIAAEEYIPLVHELQAAGYQLAGLRDDAGVVRAVAGFRLGRSLAWGRYLYVDDLVCDSNARSHGYGALLLRFVEAYGKERGCVAMHLDSGVQRVGAHRFYLRERMDIVFFHFRKVLE